MMVASCMYNFLFLINVIFTHNIIAFRKHDYSLTKIILTKRAVLVMVLINITLFLIGDIFMRNRYYRT